MTELKCTLFIDAQNVYKSARDAFFNKDVDHHTKGQFDPIRLGQIVCSRNKVVKRTISSVRVYTGRPDATKEPKTYGCHMKQCSVWEKAGIEVIHRTLRYPYNWPTEKAKEKGVDVALAVDIVTMAMDGKYDVGIIASTDTDLKPAIEYVYRRFKGPPSIEVMAWYSNKSKNRLSIAGTKIWCHYLDIDDYNNCCDLNDYSK